MEDSIDSFPEWSEEGEEEEEEVVVVDDDTGDHHHHHHHHLDGSGALRRLFDLPGDHFLIDTAIPSRMQRVIRASIEASHTRRRQRTLLRRRIVNAANSPQTRCTNKMLGTFRFLCDSYGDGGGDCSCERPTKPVSVWLDTNREAPTECRLRSIDHGAVLAQDGNEHALINNRAHLKSVQDTFAKSTRYLNAEYRALKRLGAATHIGVRQQSNFSASKLIRYKPFLSENPSIDKRLLDFVTARIDSPGAKLTRLWAAHHAKRIVLDAALKSTLASSEELFAEVDAIYTEMLTGAAPTFYARSARYAQREIALTKPWYCSVCMRRKESDPREDWPTCMVDLGCGIKHEEAVATAVTAVMATAAVGI